MDTGNFRSKMVFTNIVQGFRGTWNSILERTGTQESMCKMRSINVKDREGLQGDPSHREREGRGEKTLQTV